MKVRMTKTAAGSWGVWHAGEVVEMDEVMAAGFVAVGAGEALEPFGAPAADPEPEVETANLEPALEMALAPRARRKRSR